MVSCTVRRLALLGSFMFMAGLSGGIGYAQGFLDQLEKKAREGLGVEDTAGKDAASQDTQKSDKPAAGGAELPAPARPRTPPPLPTPSVPNSPGTESGKPARSSSILEAPALADPLNARTAETAAPADGIYLGLEAESLAGGGIGTRVVRVTDNSPAWRAGFKVGDVILAIDGFAIANLDTMVDRLTLRRPGDTIKVLVLRGGARNVELTAVLQHASLAQRIHGVNPNSPIPSPLTPAGHAWLGVVVADLSSAFRTQFGLKAFRGAAVTNVSKGSPADALSIQPGDAIVGADGRPIESARELLDWMSAKRPGDVVNLTVMRGTRSNILETTLATDPKYQPSVASRPAAPDPFGPGSLNIEAGDNTVPAVPAPGEPAEVRQLRGELKAAQDQIQSLEQRLAELESLLKKRE